MEDEYYDDYPKVPIGGDNPYYCCSDCYVSGPAINGKIEGHLETCAWRLMMEKILKDEKQIDVRKLLDRLLVKVNGVTAYHRHGNKIPQKRLNDLSNFQLDIEYELNKGI